MKTSQRPLILEAAIRVLLRKGLAGFTLDAAAAEADVSKGGLLHHFPSKEALLAGVLEFFLQRQSERIRDLVAADPEPRGRILRAYLHSSFDPAVSGLTPPEERKVFVALLAAMGNQPTLLEPLRQAMQQWTRELGPEEWLLVFAIDGLWIWNLLGALPPDSHFRDHMVQMLQEKTAP
jgi:AcrR family transcriptional regulator